MRLTVLYVWYPVVRLPLDSSCPYSISRLKPANSLLKKITQSTSNRVLKVVHITHIYSFERLSRYCQVTALYLLLSIILLFASSACNIQSGAPIKPEDYCSNHVTSRYCYDQRGKWFIYDSFTSLVMIKLLWNLGYKQRADYIAYHKIC